MATKTCRGCRALEVKRRFVRGYIEVPTTYHCALGMSITQVNGEPVCKDYDVCPERTVRIKVIKG